MFILIFREYFEQKNNTTDMKSLKTADKKKTEEKKNCFVGIDFFLYKEQIATTHKKCGIGLAWGDCVILVCLHDSPGLVEQAQRNMSKDTYSKFSF